MWPASRLTWLTCWDLHLFSADPPAASRGVYLQWQRCLYCWANCDLLSASVTCSPCWRIFRGRPVLLPASFQEPGCRKWVLQWWSKGTAGWHCFSCQPELQHRADLCIQELSWSPLGKNWTTFLHFSWQSLCLEGDLQRMESKLCLCQDLWQMMFKGTAPQFLDKILLLHKRIGRNLFWMARQWICSKVWLCPVWCFGWCLLAPAAAARTQSGLAGQPWQLLFLGPAVGSLVWCSSSVTIVSFSEVWCLSVRRRSQLPSHRWTVFWNWVFILSVLRFS